ncbi:MAG: endonuclease/exonuclease/phosphatase family protein [Planctomycetes bacterium]|nr:endonuclease/exonuclease/phosphatase family protein [Planctomycetota bacterium]MCP4771559.1 endonuclease/exonuclease/phosphatase family protein [Planctomycetota bacterium]MCP4861220.1 endonuclease/exonuclease/phosphatase family protein [Planctomycetota bacterium]
MKNRLFELSLLLQSLFLLLTFSACASPEAEDDYPRDPAIVELMTFNIRYGTANDGLFSWPARRQHVADVIRREQPDVLAIQEGLAFQLEELADVLGGYTKFGQHRDGGLKGEFSGVYVREDRVNLLGWGELWLSPTPDQLGSKGWDAALPRMAVWVDVQLHDGSNRPPQDGFNVVRIYGTHFDHRGKEARLQSAKLLAEHAKGGPPAVFMGDFNATESSAPMQAFVAASYQSAISTWDPLSTLGTFNGFKEADGGRRIDHVMVAPPFLVHEAQILDDCFDGIWPSDHFPVTAVLELLPNPSL